MGFRVLRRGPKVVAFWLSAIVLIGIGILYQNCSNVRLSPMAKSLKIPSVTDSDTEILPIPRRDPGNARIIVVLDQSFSMVWNKCPQDLDGSAPSPTGSPFDACSRAAGVDQVGYRYDVMQAWLNELRQYSMGSGDVKVMLLPFSGGKAKRPRPSASPVTGLKDQDYMKFLSLDDTSRWLAALKQEQQAMISDGSQEIMGTTIFSPIVDYAKAQIATEAQKLKDADKLATTPFEFVIISDGVYKPTLALFGLLRQVSGCPDCSKEPTHIACTCFSPSCWSGSGMPPGQYCSLLEQNFREYIGDPQINQLATLQLSLNSILGLEYDPDFLGLQLTMRFAKMNWTAVPPEDKNVAPDITKNIFDEIQHKLTRPINVYNISSPTPPFPIVNLGGDSTSYIIQNLYAINPNAYVDKFGNLVTDSDGDGLSDEEEIAKGTDPANPRSNGICLDGITANYGCQTLGCRPEIDADGDGLNECEEVTIGARKNAFDTDRDNLPDMLEVLRFLKPTEDDQKAKSSGDDFTDHDHFRKGVHPMIKLSAVPAIAKVDLNIRFFGFQLTPNEDGTLYAMGKYIVDLNNMPLTHTRAVPDSVIHEVKKTPEGAPIPNTMRLDPLAHSANVNRIYFLLQMTTMENRERISWHLLKMDVPVTADKVTISLPKDFSFKNFVQIQGERP